MKNADGLINATVLDGKGGGIALDWDGVRSWQSDQGVLWVHLDFTSDHACRWLEDESGLDPIVADALMADETRPRCAAINDGLLISLRGVNNNPGADPEDMVSIRLFCTENRVISTRRRRLLTIQDLSESIQQGVGPRSSGGLVAMLSQRLIERMSGVIRGLDERMDELDEKLLDDASVDVRSDIHELRHEIIKLRRYLGPQREALGRLYLEKVQWLSDHDRLLVREASDMISRHVEDLDSARDRAVVANEELSSRLAEQMNVRMYVLSVIAGLFLPLGFLTGLLGINVGGIPLAENPWGFVGIVVLLTLVVIGEVVLFRRKKWI